MTDDARSRQALIEELDALRKENQQLKQTISKHRNREKRTILIVDDNEDIRSVVGEMVMELGYEAKEAATSGEAMALFQKGTDQIDLVITDIVMPQEDGPDMIDRILRIIPGIKVIFMSGYAEEEIVHDAVYKVQDTNAAFIKKPFSQEDLESLIQKQMNA